jgi:hypothetical protein
MAHASTEAGDVRRQWRQGVDGRWREDEVTGAPEPAVGGRCQAPVGGPLEHAVGGRVLGSASPTTSFLSRSRFSRALATDSIPRPTRRSASAGRARQTSTAPCLPSWSRGDEVSTQSARSPWWTWSEASPGRRGIGGRASVRLHRLGVHRRVRIRQRGRAVRAPDSRAESATSGRFPSRLRSETSMGWRPAQLRRGLRQRTLEAGWGSCGRARAASHKRRGSRARCDPTKTGRHARARAR